MDGDSDDGHRDEVSYHSTGTLAVSSDATEDMAWIMYDQAALIAGMPVDDIVGYADKVFKLFQ